MDHDLVTIEMWSAQNLVSKIECETYALECGASAQPLEQFAVMSDGFEPVSPRAEWLSLIPC